MSGDHRDLHVLTHAFPTRRSSGLFPGRWPHPAPEAPAVGVPAQAPALTGGKRAGSAPRGLAQPVAGLACSAKRRMSAGTFESPTPPAGITGSARHGKRSLARLSWRYQFNCELVNEPRTPRNTPSPIPFPALAG